MLADEHLPYRQATIYIHDPDNLMVQFFPHPDMNYRERGRLLGHHREQSQRWTIGVEMLLKPQASGASYRASHARYRMSGQRRSRPRRGGFDLLFILRALVVIFPLLLILIYYRFGREKTLYCAQGF